MKTTVDIPEQTLGTLRRLTHAATDEDAILKAIEEYTRIQPGAPLAQTLSEPERLRRVEEVIKHLGTFESFPTNEEIEADQMAAEAERRRGLG